jgi:hypothetical protein
MNFKHASSASMRISHWLFLRVESMHSCVSEGEDPRPERLGARPRRLPLEGRPTESDRGIQRIPYSQRLPQRVYELRAPG